jgi:dTDP-4-amino-4,6-dideoxygalactose transaminase
VSPVPLLDLKAQYRTIRPEIEAALARVLESQRFILGEEVERFEREVAHRIGVSQAVGLSSGTDALLVALSALGVGAGDEVVTSVYSFFATAGSIARLGARPVFVDIERATYNLDPEGLAARVGPRTRALLPVHLFGRCASVERLAAVAPGVPLVEDAAQAIGATRAGRPAGSLGRAACFSFFPSKNLGGFGDGGMLVTDDPELGATARSLRIHGQSGIGRYSHSLLGGNYRLDALQAAILSAKLPHLDAWTEARRRNAARYRELFAQAGADRLGVGLPPEEDPGSHDVYNQFVLRIAPGPGTTSRRDVLQKGLAARKIGCAVYYPAGLHTQPCFAQLGLREGDFPEAESAARETLAIPIFPELSPSQIEEVVGGVVETLHRSSAL